jgi:predicted phosphodiesterase
MKIIRRKWNGLARGDTFRLYPLGDVHLGNAAADEKLFRSVVARIAADENAYWLGLGDYCDFVNRTDPRFDPHSLPSWVKMVHLGDLARAQSDRFLDIVEPIAHKCLGLVEGNHERAIEKYYERSIYSDIVAGIKTRGGFPLEHQLAFGYSGWLMLHFYRSEDDRRCSLVRVSLHHGFVGGRLAGAKALSMERWLWTHDCDLAIFGHSHNTMVQVESVESVRGERVVHDHRIGLYSGTFMDGGARYSEVKGYLPLPITQPHIILTPGAAEQRDRVRVVA